MFLFLWSTELFNLRSEQILSNLNCHILQYVIKKLKASFYMTHDKVHLLVSSQHSIIGDPTESRCSVFAVLPV